MTLNHETSRSDPHAHAGWQARRVARRVSVALGAATQILLATLLSSVALAAPSGGPHYDVPRGFTRCPDARAWHGFFKWASADNASCREAARFMRAYADKVGDEMPTQVGSYRCRIHYWRNEEGDVYASRHTCSRRDVVVRFYGMV